ncbi:MAG: hypothetical protein FD137_118 [Spirochaetes bacterium]|nr:MAG: hypothetical protein FD137_118 [Spirochaetota bacterium]
MADSRIKSASEILAGFFDREVASAGGEYRGFSQAWKNIAGPRLGEHSYPRDIKHGILLVETEHQGWIQLLLMQQNRIVAEISKKFPSLGIRGMAFRLSEEPNKAGEPAGLQEISEEVPVSLESIQGTSLPEELRARFAKIKNYPNSN